MNREELKKQYPYMTELQTKYDHVTCGKNIRAELKKNFPNVKFRVRYSSFSGGDSYDIDWEDGCKKEDVDKLVKKFEIGRFDGMTDSSWCEISDFNEVFGGVKFVMTQRTISEAAKQSTLRLFDGLTSENWKEYDYLKNAQTEAAKEVAEIAVEHKNYFGCFTFDELLHVMAGNMDFSKPEPKKQKASQPEQTEDDGISIFDYSEKSFVVTGDTRKIKDDLKRLGGRFNARLTCGCGWVFKKADEDKVWDFLVSADIA